MYRAQISFFGNFKTILMISTPEEYAIIFIAGAIGALGKDIVIDGKLTLPKKIDGDFSLGFLGGMILGGIAGITIDGSFVTAAMAGFSGSAVITNLVQQKNTVAYERKPDIEQLIRSIAIIHGISADLAVKVAQCESGLNPRAKNVNAPDSIDRGIFQINSKWHPEVTDEQAYDPIFATEFFCNAFKAGNLSWWDASKKCWDKK